MIDAAGSASNVRTPPSFESTHRNAQASGSPVPAHSFCEKNMMR